MVVYERNGPGRLDLQIVQIRRKAATEQQKAAHPLE